MCPGRALHHDIWDPCGFLINKPTVAIAGDPWDLSPYFFSLTLGERDWSLRLLFWIVIWVKCLRGQEREYAGRGGVAVKGHWR